MKTNNRDKIYEKKARLYPVVFTMLTPCFIAFLFIIYCFKLNASPIIRVITAIVPAGLIAAAFSYYLKNVVRAISKWIFQFKYYKKDESCMPTTELLLWHNDEFTDDYKIRIRNKIFSKFDVELFSKEDEASNEKKARKLIAEVVPQIRDITREDVILFNYNCYYGSVRNLIGGCALALIIIAIFLFINMFTHALPIYYILIALVMNILPVLFSRSIMNFFGHDYAKKLYEAFMKIQ